MGDAKARRRAAGVAISRISPSRPVAGLRQDVRQGLARRIKELPPKYFYDRNGSELFDQICGTPEYYLTRTEYSLLERHANAVLSRCHPRNMLEFGSGMSTKTRLLLSAWTGAGARTYWPFDVSEAMLKAVAGELAQDYPDIEIRGLIGDYTAGLRNLPRLTGAALYLFLGSTLGNFSPLEAKDFLERTARRMQPGDYLLLGADLDKAAGVIEAAYNDAAGVTAQFNKNVLAVINERLAGDFDLERFAHWAFYDRERRRVEMHLVSELRQTVTLDGLGLTVGFEAGESIRTEISRKFTATELRELLVGAGLELECEFIDATHPYALILARKP